MSKIIKAILLLFSSYELAFSSFSTEEEIKKWSSYSNIQSLKEAIESEEIKKIKNNESDLRDYGYSFAGINYLQAQMYQAIFKQSTETTTRIPVMDIGSGHNHNAWKILTAGGKVTTVEPQLPTAIQGMKVIKSHSLFFLQEGEKVPEAYSPLTKSIFELKNLENYREAYNIVSAFNVLHMMSPPQCDEFIKIMHTVLKPEGYAFVEVHTPSKLPFLIDIFMQEKKNKNPNPGYLIVDRFIFRQVNTNTKAEENCGLQQIKAYPTNNYSLLPGEEKPGFYEENQTEIKWDIVRKPSKNITIFKRKSHAVMHIFDRETLSQFFTKNGFEVKEVFYINHEGYKVDENLTANTLKENSYALGLIARKI